MSATRRMTRLGITRATPATGPGRKTVITDIGPVELEVPRDRAGTFEPVMVPKREAPPGRGGPDGPVAVGQGADAWGDLRPSGGDLRGQGVQGDHDPDHRRGDGGDDGEWQNRPLDAVYPVVFIDAIHVKIREGQVANRPIYVAIGVTVDGERDIFGLWAGEGGEGAKYWAHVLTEIKNRGTKDVCIVVCDGLTGLARRGGSVWPQTIVQACVVHSDRNSSATPAGGTGRRWPRTSSPSTPRRPRRPPWSASPSSPGGGRRAYPAIVKLWENAWAEFVPFLSFDPRCAR
jgi:putative transposase